MMNNLFLSFLYLVISLFWSSMKFGENILNKEFNEAKGSSGEEKMSQRTSEPVEMEELEA